MLSDSPFTLPYSSQVRAMRARLCSPQAVWGVPQLCGALPGRMHCGQRPGGVQVCVCSTFPKANRQVRHDEGLHVSYEHHTDPLLGLGETCLLSWLLPAFANVSLTSCCSGGTLRAIHPYLHSACEDGYVLAVYKNWEDPPLGSQWSEESRGCFIPRTYCFSCLDGNCAPGHCEVGLGVSS